MCLATTFKEGFIAKENITVYKQLEKKDSKWFTSQREWEVELDSMLIPKKDSPEITEYSNNFTIHGGVIHSYTTTKVYTCNPTFLFKAIIPEGTRFWIQEDLMEIASERLYLTSEMVYKESETDFSSLFSEYCLDLLLKNGSRVRWSSEINIEEVKGMFVYDSQVISLEVYKDIFSIAPLPNLPGQILGREDAESEFDGEERTEFLRENYPKIEILEKLPEDSYIPSLGELSRALENFLFINLTRKALGLDILGYDWFWSSTPYSDEHIWCICPHWYVWTDWDCYRWNWNNYYVLHFKKDL